MNLADLTPLSLNWETIVNYDDPALHVGFAAWPTGDPDGAGADNWRMARVDGDSNGEVSNSDITSIALHFQERIDGYRVYRKAPGEAVFTMLPAPNWVAAASPPPDIFSANERPAYDSSSASLRARYYLQGGAHVPYLCKD